MSSRKPRSGGARARRSFTPAQKLELLAGYEQALAAGEGGAWLRREGLYSSLITEWRKARDAGLLQGKPAGESVGRPSPEQAEIARLKRQLEVSERKLATTQTALEIMGKAHALLEAISESEDRDDQQIPDAFRSGSRGVNRRARS
ncbi:transposase [Kineosporia sp. NBRC 101731]|nr:transposase [Kineosporia sp. NBRC 101731]